MEGIEAKDCKREKGLLAELEGKAEGKAEGIAEVAKNMLKFGESFGKGCSLTGLTFGASAKYSTFSSIASVKRNERESCGETTRKEEGWILESCPSIFEANAWYCTGCSE